MYTIVWDAPPANHKISLRNDLSFVEYPSRVAVDDNEANAAIRPEEPKMGWLGTVFVGAMIGLADWLMRGRGETRGWLRVPIAAVCALMAKMLGNITGLFDDGSSLEWLASVGIAIVVVLVFDAQSYRFNRFRGNR